MKRFLAVEKTKYIIQMIYETKVLFPDQKLITINQEEISEYIDLGYVDSAVRLLESSGSAVLVSFKKWNITTVAGHEKTVGEYKIRLTEKFESFYKELKERVELDDIEVTIYFNDDVITLYDSIIQTPRAGSENSEVFRILFNNPYKAYTKKMLENKLNTPLTKSLSKIVENLNFTGTMRNIFFSVSKDTIMFKNPVKLSMVTIVELESYRYRTYQP